MKDAILRGHSLTDDVMKSVKGGVIIKGSNSEVMNFCPNCKEPYKKDDENYFKGPDENGFYTAICKECGSMIKVV